ncbi:dTMP kinase [Micromonospora aurantiaca]|uniref:dTMP kinase n=1 Tax=Micromonospora aurantiaca (nom. illeg.) TaxID=47850 RepID=UPI0033B66617
MSPTGLSGLDQLLGEQRISGRNSLAETMRILSTEAASDSDGRNLDSQPLTAYYEPRLYCQLAQPGFDAMSLSQLLFSDSPDKSVPLVAITDEAGIVSFPGFGRCATDRPATVVELRYDEGSRAFVDQTDAAAAGRYPLVPSRFIPDTDIEIVEYVDPILRRFLDDHIESAEQLTMVDDPGAYSGILAQALDLVAAVRPTLHESLTESLRAVFLFRHPTTESFAALGMHGAIFLNVAHGDDLAFFVEHLVHQGGHVLFSEATLERATFFRVDPDSPLSDFTGSADSRALYDAFHGLFTEHVESQIFAAAMAQNLVPDDSREFRVHLLGVLFRHGRDLDLIDPYASEVFSELGHAVYAQFQESHQNLMRRHPQLGDPKGMTISRVDFTALEGLFRPTRTDRGLLISVVGFDGSGKTTQVERVAEAFRAQGREVVETRQPTDWYRQLAEVQTFHDHGGPVETAHILALLAAADRRRHVMEVVDPALARGAVVICDRYVYATFGVFVHRGVDFALLAAINAGIPRPDYAFNLRVPTQELLRRLRARDGQNLKYEEKSTDRIESITSMYEELGSELIPIDGSASPEEVTASILEHLKGSLDR